MAYDHREIEARAKEKWEKLHLYETTITDSDADPYYLLFEFPYPSGDLHTGHWYAFAMPDIYARYLRMQGKQVLFPVGFDAFGLPAENAAMKHGVDPKEWTYANMDRMREQLKSMGASFDWSKEVVTCSPEYYRWTQWLFAKFFEHGLVERKEAPVKWCPKDQTVLANEQVHNGQCERCGTEVVERSLTQWFVKITKYARRLIDDLDPLPWREDIKQAQREWIGESQGAKLFFPLGGALNDDLGALEVFTTRPDTLYGATYVVIAPEHPLVDTLYPFAANKDAVTAYRTATSKKTERERSENKEKTGVPLEGIWAINPATQQQIPVYIADYVLATYGTGAVMAVPAHDERDFEFAQKHNLPITQVVLPQLVDSGNPPQEGKENTERTIIIAVVHDPETDSYLTLKWKKQPWTTFITGGVEEGEDVIEAAYREIKEETGYTDLKLSRVLGGDLQSSFYAAHKGVNRVVRSTAILFELMSDAQVERDAAEEAEYDLQWIPAKELPAAKLQHAEFALIWQRIQTGMDAYTGDGILINSGEFSGQQNRDALLPIAESAGGEAVTNYRLRDWLVSRQRYWGCPIPIVYDPEGTPHAIPSEHLPWLLPTDIDFSSLKDTGGKSPLAQSKELEERVESIFGKGWTPEYDTLDTFVDSSWYFLRYLAPQNDHDFSDQKLLKHWMPVNRYSGGSEHTTMHLLYSRFFHKALFDLALVPTAEPFNERFNRGIILGPDGQKMSKSKGNVINPDEFVQKFGADAVRTYLAFIGPYNEPGQYPWKLDGVAAMRRFLDRVEKLAQRVGEGSASPSIEKLLAKTSAKVGEDIERFKFNTAISSLMVALNEMEKLQEVPRPIYSAYLQLLAPFAPLLTEHLFEQVATAELLQAGSIHATTWPKGTVEAETEGVVVVQVNGKRKGELTLALTTPEDEAIKEAIQLNPVREAMAGRRPSRVVYVPGRILNIVV